MKQCDNGHFYDDNRFSSCPYCQNGQGGGKTTPLGGAFVQTGASDPGKTMAAPSGVTPSDIGKTMAAPAFRMAADAGKTVGIMQKKTGIDPVVGFVIITEGPQRGVFYKLSSGRNFIGRASDQDVVLADDDTISREGHAIITYDAKHNAFFVSAGGSRGITYLNDKLVDSAEPLKAYDVIEVGKTSLVFLPLCGDKFTWKEE